MRAIATAPVYLIAMLFVILTWDGLHSPGRVARRAAWFGVIEMFVFLFIMVVGYFYAWKKAPRVET